MAVLGPRNRQRKRLEVHDSLLECRISFSSSGTHAIDMTLLYVVFIVFISTLIRSTFGFGEALIAVPLLAFFVPITVATPLVALLSITIGAVVVLQDWRKIHLRSAGWLIVATLFGIPLGLLLLTSGHPTLIKIVLALTIMSFALYSLIGTKQPVLSHDSPLWLSLCGFVAGILGGAYGMNGPPLVVYGAMRQWSAQHFRATLQGYFLPASLVGLAGYVMMGLWVPAVTHFYLLSLPVAVPAIFLGRFVNQRMRQETFIRYVYAGLVAVGFLLLLQAASGEVRTSKHSFETPQPISARTDSAKGMHSMARLLSVNVGLPRDAPSGRKIRKGDLQIALPPA